LTRRDSVGLIPMHGWTWEGVTVVQTGPRQVLLPVRHLRQVQPPLRHPAEVVPALIGGLELFIRLAPSFAIPMATITSPNMKTPVMILSSVTGSGILLLKGVAEVALPVLLHHPVVETPVV